MKSSKQLKEERASKITEQQTLVRGVEGDLEGENLTRFDNLQSEIDAFAGSIKRAEQFEANERAAASVKGLVINEPVEEPKEQRFSLLRSLSALANGKPLHADDAAIHERAVEEMRAEGLNIPEGNAISIPGSVMRAQSVGDDAGAKGGALVGSTPKMVRPLQPVLPIEQLGVNVMSGLVGDVPLPTSGAFSFSYTGETDAVSGSDVDFAGPTLKPKRCSGVVDISKKLLLQSSFNVEEYIIEQINIAYGNAVTLAALNGAGGDAPSGLYSLITSNIDTTAGALSHDTIVALEGLVDAADGTNVNRGYLADTKIRAKAKATKIDAGSGIFLTDGKELNGYNFMASTLVPTLDDGASHPVIFGDWNQLTVGYWGAVSIIVDPYTQAASGKVRLIIEGYSDVALTNEKAFAINKVATV
ncbi:phage major capsid protein [Lutibacter holmesii]|uniref:Phage major capsid protein n=1 Tax=Lutibacter holmesii TaxID=1137985 RepID=A0ABW3WKA8_9FLAO